MHARRLKVRLQRAAGGAHFAEPSPARESRPPQEPPTPKRATLSTADVATASAFRSQAPSDWALPPPTRSTLAIPDADPPPAAGIPGSDPGASWLRRRAQTPV